MANQLIRVFLKFNFMALQHQDEQSLTVLWVNELYPLHLQLLNSLLRVIECYTFNLPQGAHFAMGCNSPWSLEHASGPTSLAPGLSWDTEHLLQADEQPRAHTAPAGLSHRAGATGAN